MTRPAALLTSGFVTLRRALTVFAMWGGIELKVPPGWAVDMRVAAFLGGYEDKTTLPAAADAPRLIVTGLVTMGGAEVKNPKNS